MRMPARIISVPAAGSQLNVNVGRRERFVGAGPNTSSPGQANVTVHGASARNALTGRDVDQREDRDDDQVRRVGLDDLAAVVGRVASPPARRRAVPRPVRGASRSCARWSPGSSPSVSPAVAPPLPMAAVACAGSARSGDSGGLPHPQQPHDGGRRHERGDDVGERHRDVVGGDELGDAEGEPRDDGRQPGLADAALAVDDEDQHQRDDDGEDRRLPADHRAEGVHVQAAGRRSRRR